jgi:hypothetical protein
VFHVVDELSEWDYDRCDDVDAGDACRSCNATRSTRAVAVRSLPPGECLVVAVDYVEEGQWNDPEYLETFRRGAGARSFLKNA